ncbi:hypothetical protein BaRGS_00001294, partial [Batillaria attramentaria]
GKKELHRAKTLPVINVAKILPSAAGGVSAAACPQQPPAKRDQRPIPYLSHKYSVPDIAQSLASCSSA